jgi:integrase/recombinase XerD
MPNLSLHQARLGFKFSNQTENKSDHTVHWYDMHLERLELWLLATDKTQLADVTTDDLRQFIAHLQGKTVVYENSKYRKPVARAYSPHTIRGVVATLSAFFKWAVAEGLLARDPMERIKRPKAPKTFKERFSEDEVKQLVAACKSYPGVLASRNHAIVLFLLSTALRAAELCGLTMDHLDLEHHRAHVTGKGMKDRDVHFGNNTTKALWHYLNVRQASPYCDRVFLSREGKALRPDRLTKILRDIGERAHVPNCHPHRFRHTAARLLLRNGVNQFAVQALLGHESIETTAIYARQEREDVEQAVQRADPVDRWGL